MTSPRKNVLVLSVLLVLLAGSAASMWRLSAQSGANPKQAPVQTFTNRIPPSPVTNGDRGATYHSLERRAKRVTTRFADGIAIADRAADGRMSTRLTDLAGNEVAWVRVHRVDAESDSLEFAVAGRPSRHAARRSGLRPTLEWSNEQVYALWKDGDALDGSSLEWQDTLMRPVGASRRNAIREVVQTDTEWDDGLSSSVTKKIGTHESIAGRKTTGPVFISSFRKDGLEVGSSQWWPEERAFAWAFPGLTEGYVDASTLQKAGGWPLAPDMAWMSTQSLAFYQFHTLLKERGTVSERRGGWLEKIGGYLAPKLHANEPGCDSLHWLDGSIFRPCCDSHDLCYSKETPACSYYSWWMWWSSWRCTECNMFAVVCFLTGSGSHVFQRYP